MFPDLSIVIPLYNEERRISGCLKACLAWMDRLANEQGIASELIFSDDGSADRTVEFMQKACASDERIHSHYGVHYGKGKALRSGVALARARQWILVADCDLATPLEDFGNLRNAINDGADIAIGSRHLHSSTVVLPLPWHRQFLGRLSNQLIRLVLQLPYKDTQCGFKLFTPQSIEVLNDCSSNGFSYDFELLVRAQHLNYKVTEIGVTWKHDSDSRVQLRDYITTLHSLYAVRKIAKQLK